MRRNALLFLAPLVALAPAAAEARPECTQYAQTAIRQVNQAVSSNCGFSGPRWSTDEGLHYGYCIYSFDRNEAGNIDHERNLRDQSLSKCTVDQMLDSAHQVAPGLVPKLSAD